MARELGNAILVQRQEQSLLNYTMNRLRQALGVEYGAILLTRGNMLSIAAMESDPREPSSPLSHIVGPIDRLLHAGLGQLAVYEQVEESSLIPRTADGKPLTGGRLSSLAVLPLQAHGAPMGAVVFGTAAPRQFTQEESDFLQLVGLQLSTALREVRLLASLDSATNKLAAHGETSLPATQQLDGLTGLANRQYLLEELQRITSDTINVGGQLSLLLIDIDHFRHINERNGQQFGDTVLTRTADVIKAGIRGRDMIARFNADQYCVLLPNTPGVGAIVVVERLRERLIGVTYENGAEKWNATFSIGVACLSKRISTPEQLLAKAEACLAEAKFLGRDQIIIDWNEAMEGMEAMEE